MQIAVVNARAQRRYGDFVGAMDMVLEALEATEKLIAGMDPHAKPNGWRVATKDELVAMLQRAVEDLHGLRQKAKKYEAELVSRDWRV